MLGLTLHADGLYRPALTYLNDCLAALPDFVPALVAVARLRASCPEPGLRDAAEAVEKAVRAAAIEDGSSPFTLDTLAAAYAEAGRFDDAVATAQRALELFGRAPVPAAVLAGCRQRLALYRERRPYRDIPGTGANGAPFGGEPE
jgi:tetratricopeptide (TPR) repeat protein